jgi:uncharacterized protein (DUF1697 family)
MPTFVVLLRAVNVGQRKLRMEHARKVLEDNAFLDVASHIQTGNLLVTTPLRSPAKVELAVGECLSEAAGFDIVAMARRPEEVRALVASVDGIPLTFPEGAGRYVAFCRNEIGAQARRALEAWETAGERAHVVGKDVVVEIDKAFHEARLGNAQVEKIIGGPATTRNLTVVRALAQKWGR